MRSSSHSGTTRHVERAVRAALAAIVWTLGVTEAVAQTPGSADLRSPFVSRAVLEQQAAEAERAAMDSRYSPEAREVHRGDAWVLRKRLVDGDFSPGDRIVLMVPGEAALTDTFTVRPGPELLLSNLPPIPLKGVLRSELEPHLTTELGRYLREPNVIAIPLIRVAVLGAIGRPGYYHVPADMLLSDLVMAAGGPGQADLNRSQIRRGDGTLYEGRDVDVALGDGMTLDMLNLRSGDEFVLEERREVNWGSILRVITLVSGLAALATRLGN